MRQAEYILELRLRRLTKFSRIELEAERDELRAQIEELEKLLADESLLRKLVSSELAEVAKAHGTPRRTVLLESAGAPASVGAPLEVADDPCWVLLSATGLLARTAFAGSDPGRGRAREARRHRRGGAHDRARPLRDRHLGRADGPGLRPRPAHPGARPAAPRISPAARRRRCMSTWPAASAS